MKYLLSLLLFTLVACTLSADQEASLNNAMVSYVNSKNNGAVMSYVAFTHPNVVAYYKNKGDSLFTLKFDLSDDENTAYLQDGNIREIESEKDRIHVKYNFLSINGNEYDPSGSEVTILAISEDRGNSWFFIEESDYFNDAIIEVSDRLIK